jgi:hypothetical protein
MNNRTEGNDSPDRPEWAIDSTRDAIRVTRPDSLTDEQWADLKTATTSKLDRLLVLARLAAAGPRGDRCTKRDWCELSDDDHDQHAAEADIPVITATAYREDMEVSDDGAVVPYVIARLVENEWSNVYDRHSIYLAIVRPRVESEVNLTLKEAGLLAKALHELLDVAP